MNYDTCQSCIQSDNKIESLEVELEEANKQIISLAADRLVAATVLEQTNSFKAWEIYLNDKYGPQESSKC